MTRSPLPTLIAGLPRSGTTLVARILNEQPDTVALAEPMRIGRMSSDPQRLCLDIETFAADMRRRALHEGRVENKTVDGRPVGNFMGEVYNGRDLRKGRGQIREIAVGKPLTPGFRLFIKQPAAFSAIAPFLAERFPLFACIRSPLAVLASWQTVDIPLNRGRTPVGERLDPSLRDRLDRIPGPLDRQVEVMRTFLVNFSRLPRARILRFEDLARDPAGALRAVCPGIGQISLELETQSVAERYPNIDTARLRQALRPIEDVIRHHYPEGLPY